MFSACRRGCKGAEWIKETAATETAAMGNIKERSAHCIWQKLKSYRVWCWDERRSA